MNAPASFYDQRHDIGSAGPAEIDDKVGVALRNLRPAMCDSFHASLLDQPPGEIARRVLEDGTGALLRRLRPLAMLFILFDNSFQSLRIIAMQPYRQLHNDFGWFDQPARWLDWIALRVKGNVATGAKAALAIAQVDLGVHIAPQHRHGNLVLVVS